MSRYSSHTSTISMLHFCSQFFFIFQQFIYLIVFSSQYRSCCSFFFILIGYLLVIMLLVVGIPHLSFFETLRQGLDKLLILLFFFRVFVDFLWVQLIFKCTQHFLVLPNLTSMQILNVVHCNTSQILNPPHHCLRFLPQVHLLHLHHVNQLRDIKFFEIIFNKFLEFFLWIHLVFFIAT